MATQSVKIPVELELQKLQSSINTLQAAFNKVKPGTKIYNDISRQLEKAKKDFLNLQIASEKVFSNTAEVTKFEKSFGRVTDEVTAAARMLEQLDFDSLNFSTEDLKGIQAYKDRISEINKELGNIKTDALKQLYANSQDLQETFKELSLNINTTSLDKAVKDVSTKTKQIRKQVEGFSLDILGKEAERDKATEEMTSLEKLKDTVKNLTDPRFFKANKAFKNTQVFKDWLKSLGLDQESIDKLVAKGAKNMARIYPEIEKAVQAAIGKKSTTISNAEKALVSLEAKRAAGQSNLNKYESSLGQLEGIEIDPKLAQQIQALQEEAQRSRLEIEKLKQELVATKGPAKDAGQAVDGLNDNLENIHDNCRKTAQGIEQTAEATKKLNNIQDAIKRWFGFNEVINLTKRLVTQAISHIRELDDVMTQIAIVTNMTQQELWNQMDTYSNMARQYGASIKGVYEVSQLYYQQGLQTAEVMELTAETLKMAKIANLDYSDATNYMTVAIRGFKLEMSDASTVTDVYSALAATTASDTRELAIAMSKTASSAEAVGSSFEATSAMIATMVSVTREAPENIGSALKSIISRFGEMTTNPLKLVDSEGEEMSLNKVDKALQSVGISLQDANGNFRDFDDVILELSKSWDTIDINTQRYIATIMAGNRQQSRFLALVGNYEEYAKALNTAESAEGAGTLQALKYMDSLSAKWEQFKVSIQEFYTASGLENVFKGVLESLTQLVKVAARTPKMFKAIPVSIIALVTTFVRSLKQTGMQLLNAVEGPLEKMKAKLTEIKGTSPVTIKIKTEIDPNQVNQTIDQAQAITNGRSPIIANNEQAYDFYASPEEKRSVLQQAFSQMDDGKEVNLQSISYAFNLDEEKAAQFVQEMKSLGEEKRESFLESFNAEETGEAVQEALDSAGESISASGGKFDKAKGFINKYSDAIGLATSSLSTFIAAQGEVNSKQNEIAQGISGGINIFTGAARAWAGDYVGGIMQIISGIGPLFDGLHYSIEEQLEYATAKAEDLNNKAVQAKADHDTIKNSVKQLEVLEEQRYDSAEAAEEYQAAANELGKTYPQLIQSFDDMGNVVLDLTNSEEILAEARKKSNKAALDAAQAELEASRLKEKQAQENFKNNFNTGAEQGLLNYFLTDHAEKTLGSTPSNDYGTYQFGSDGKHVDISNVGNYFVEEDAISHILYEILGDSSFGDFNHLEPEQQNSILSDFYTQVEGMDLDNPENIKIGDWEFNVASQVNAVKDLLYLKQLESEALELGTTKEDLFKEDIKEAKEIINETRTLKENISSGNYTSNEINNYIQRLKDFVENNPYSAFSSSFSTMIQIYEEQGAEALIDYETQQKITEAHGKQAIAEAVSLFVDTESSFINESTGLFSALQEQLYTAYESALIDEKDLTVEDFISQTENEEIIEKYNTFWSGLNEKQQEAFNLLESNKGDYTLSELEAELKKYNLKSGDIIFDQIVGIYKDSQEKVLERFNNRTSDLSSDYNNEIKTLQENLGYNLLDSVSQQLSFAKETNFEMLEPIFKLYEELNKLGPEAEKIAASADLFTINGIYQFVEALKNAGFNIDDKQIENLLNAVNINLNTEFETFSSSAISKLETFEEALSNATEGMDFEEASKMAERLGLSLTQDFRFEDGNYFLDDIEGIKTSYEIFNKELATQLTNAFNSKIEALNEERRKLLEENESLADVVGQREESASQTVAENTARISQIDEESKNLTIAHENSITALEQYLKYQTNIAYLTAGLYDQFIAELGGKGSVTELLAAARESDTTLRTYLEKTMGVGEEVIDRYIEAISNKLNSINDDILSLILDGNLGKGNSVDISHLTKKTDLEAYTTITAENVGELFSKMYGDNYEAYNDAMRQYMEDSSPDISGMLADMASDLEHIDYGSVFGFADAIGKSYEEIKNYFVDNLDGTFSTNLHNFQAKLDDWS